MASTRRVDTAFFEQRWVDKLAEAGESQYVLLFLYLVITCPNPVGIFEVNPRTWNFKLAPSKPFTGEDVFVKFGRRIRRIDGHPDKGIIVGFCDFQRSFGQQSAQWQWVEKSLAAVGLTYDDLLHFDEDAKQPEFDLGLPPAIGAKEKAKRETPQRCIVPPKVEWVRDYCSTRNNGIDAQAFIDFYSSKGWLIGKERMKDWQAAVRTWEQRRKAEAPVVPATLAPVKNVVGTVRRKF